MEDVDQTGSDAVTFTADFGEEGALWAGGGEAAAGEESADRDDDALDAQIEAAMASAAASSGNLDEISEEDMPAWMR